MMLDGSRVRTPRRTSNLRNRGTTLLKERVILVERKHVMLGWREKKTELNKLEPHDTPLSHAALHAALPKSLAWDTNTGTGLFSVPVGKESMKKEKENTALAS